MAQAHQIDRFLMALIGAVLVLTLGVYFWDTSYFTLTYAAEDGLVEYGTAIFLFVASLILLRNMVAIKGRATTLAVVLTAFYALLFFYAAGEEISWGQRIFGWESGEFFQENNKQFETNTHNMVIGGVHLAKTLFGPVLTTVLLLYLVVLPLLYPRAQWVRRLAHRMAIPVPGMRHAVLALAASLMIAAIDVSRKWEVYELVFSLLAASIFLLPQNRDEVT